MASHMRNLTNFYAEWAARKDAKGPKLDDWEDKGHDTCGDPVVTRPACGACNSTGAACGHEGCNCCPVCNPIPTDRLKRLVASLTADELAKITFTPDELKRLAS